MNNRKNKKPTTIEDKESKVKDYGNDPFFVKKSNKSKLFLEKNGFPPELVHSAKSRSL